MEQSLGMVFRQLGSVVPGVGFPNTSFVWGGALAIAGSQKFS